MKRHGARPLAPVLDEVLKEVTPGTALARVQERWRSVAGPAVAAEAEPTRERDGIVTVACSSAAWAHELDLLAPELLERLNSTLQREPAGPRIRGFRFVTGPTTARL